jgi:hypothetical protein
MGKQYGLAGKLVRSLEGSPVFSKLKILPANESIAVLNHYLN